MRSAIQALSIDNDDVKEHSYVFFANTSKVMGHGFDPYLATLLPHLLAVITENELIAGGDSDDDEADADDDDGSDQGKDMRLNVQEGFINNRRLPSPLLVPWRSTRKNPLLPILSQL